MFKFFKSKAGLTLTELMICVLVLGILCAVAVPSFKGIIYKQRRNDCRNQRVIMAATIGQVMSGMIDNGKPQNLIPTLCSTYVGQHKVYTYKPVYDDDNVQVTDKDHEPVTEVVSGWQGRQLYYLEDHKDANGDGICDVCKNPVKSYIRGSNHIDSSHLVYYDAEGQKLDAGDEGVELGVTIINEPTAYLLVSQATISDIRGGYRYAEITIQNSWLAMKETADAEKAQQLKLINEQENGKYVNYPDASKRQAAIEECLKAYNSQIEKALGDSISQIQKSSAPAKNNTAFACKDYTYAIGCQDGYFLKKFFIGFTSLTSLFANGEIPVCPFDSDGKDGYFYYITADGSVHCSCPECQ